MKKKIIIYSIATLIIIMAAASAYYFFYYRKLPKVWSPQNALQKSSAPSLADSGDVESLVRSIDADLRYFEKADPLNAVAFGKEWVPISQIKESLLDFKSKLLQYRLTDTFFNYIKKNYRFYRSAADEVLFTGYYEADLRGSLTPSAEYRFPLYRTPDDLIRIDLSKFYFYHRDKDLPPLLRGRVALDKKNTIIPYYSRREIDDFHYLAGKGLELVWVDNLVDVFFLQIQGSGIVQLDNGTNLRIGFDETNGHPYRAIGKLLLQQNVLTYENMSMQTIRQYLDNHPGKVTEILNYNPSYVFFRLLEEGPIGFIGVPLTPYRSLAMDKGLFPKGGLCYIETTVPVFDEQKKVQAWKPFRGFLLNQDTGGAIRSPGRADLFTGYGEPSRLTAGHMKQTGMFYFLIKK